MDVVVLAGGRCSPELAKAAGVEERAMIPIDGRPIVETIVARLRPIGPVCLVGGPENLGDRRMPGGANFIESVEQGLRLVRSDRFLLSTADMPYLSTDAALDLIERSRPEVLLSYPIIRAVDVERRFPGMRRTTLALREGRFTGGNIAVVHRKLMERALPLLRNAYEVRKSPIRLAAMIGIKTLARIVLCKVMPRTLTIHDLEATVGEFLGAPVQAVVTPYPELGGDIDSAEQYLSLLALQKADSSAVI